MDAIKLLKKQHKEVDRLFKAFENSEEGDQKQLLFEQIADGLVVHATIEERHFYPAVRVRQTEEELEEAYDEHLEIKKLLADCLDSTDHPGFDGKVAALEGAVLHHVEEEETELFPNVEKLLGKDALEALGQVMEADAEAIKSMGEPRKNLEVEIEPPAPQP
jgi:hemerythrin superfamily protein